ncbi:hypothetical protein LCGC14_1657520, partial [marine sediment metagenome]
FKEGELEGFSTGYSRLIYDILSELETI